MSFSSLHAGSGLRGERSEEEQDQTDSLALQQLGRLRGKGSVREVGEGGWTESDV